MTSGIELVFPIIVAEGETSICELDKDGRPKVSPS